jgi:hypothetical protein
MTKEELFDIWAPHDGHWSQWAKPVLFACMEEASSMTTTAPFASARSGWDLSGIPAVGQSALIVDLPGVESVRVGLILAEQGYRPVPLFNAVPGPSAQFFASPTAIVDVYPILVALQQEAAQLSQLVLAPDAPPAFLLDAHRRGGGQAVSPGRFDNRSISFTTDFPSATRLQNAGIRDVILVQQALPLAQPDLAHILRRWQEAGLTVLLKRLDEPGTPRALDIPKPSGFGWLWQRALEVLGLRRHGLGGFGGVVPIPSSG